LQRHPAGRPLRLQGLERPAARRVEAVGASARVAPRELLRGNPAGSGTQGRCGGDRPKRRSAVAAAREVAPCLPDRHLA